MRRSFFIASTEPANRANKQEVVLCQSLRQPFRDGGPIRDALKREKTAVQAARHISYSAAQKTENKNQEAKNVFPRCIPVCVCVCGLSYSPRHVCAP